MISASKAVDENPTRVMKPILTMAAACALSLCTMLPSAAADPPAVHGMLLVGEKTLYLSHLPMFHSPHDYQVILEVTFKAGSGDPAKTYVADRRSTGEKVYTVVPERFVLPDVVKEQRSFRADIFRGHFERPGAQRILTDVTVQIVSVAHFRKFAPQEPRPAKLEAIVFGKSEEEIFLAHFIRRPPDFDQVVGVRLHPPLRGEMPFNGWFLTTPYWPSMKPLQKGAGFPADIGRNAWPRAEITEVYYTELGELAR